MLKNRRSQRMNRAIFDLFSHLFLSNQLEHFKTKILYLV